MRRARRACEGAARGGGVPASAGAGVRGGAPSEMRRARRACEGAARGGGVPASAGAGVRGGAPIEMTTNAYALIGLTAIVAALISVLTFSVLRFGVAARDRPRH